MKDFWSDGWLFTLQILGPEDMVYLLKHQMSRWY